MTNRYRVSVTEIYARGADRPWSLIRRVLGHDLGGSCQNPVTVRGFGQQRQIACCRRLPTEQQCAPCRVHIAITDVRRITL